MGACRTRVCLYKTTHIWQVPGRFVTSMRGASINPMQQHTREYHLTFRLTEEVFEYPGLLVA